jgi:hypothetical protein
MRLLCTLYGNVVQVGVRTTPLIYIGTGVHEDIFPVSVAPRLVCPFHDRDVIVTNCGRVCIYRKKINISSVLAGQKLGIKEVEDGIWLVTFMQYDLGYNDFQQRTLQTIDNPFGTKLSPMS